MAPPRLPALAAALATAAALVITCTPSAGAASPAGHATAVPAQHATAVASQAAGVPGDIVSARQIPAPGFGYAKVWRIQYSSTDANRAPIVVSGTVVVPNAAYNGPRPVVGYAPGTHGLGDQCAPSRHLEAGDDQEGLLIHQYGWKGYAVAVTDYQGLGTPGDHAYMVAKAAGQALIDVVRAARKLPGTGLPSDSPVALVGYSQGGQAAAWAAQLAASYAPEMKVKAVAAGGTPANLRQVADYNAGKPNFGYVLAAGIGMDTAYPALNLRSYLNDAGRAGIDVLRNSCDISPYANKQITDYTTTNPLTQPDWVAALDAQRAGGIKPAMPVLLYHSTSDEIIPYSGATKLRQDWCGKGANVTFWTYYLLQHAATAAVASPSVTSWVGDRLAGSVPSNGC